jgi:hypothetical protein
MFCDAGMEIGTIGNALLQGINHEKIDVTFYIFDLLFEHS